MQNTSRRFRFSLPQYEQGSVNYSPSYYSPLPSTMTRTNETLAPYVNRARSMRIRDVGLSLYCLGMISKDNPMEELPDSDTKGRDYIQQVPKPHIERPVSLQAQINNDWVILKNLLTTNMVPANFSLPPVKTTVVDVPRLTDTLFFTLMPQTQVDHSHICDKFRNDWTALAGLIRNVGEGPLESINTFVESLITYSTTCEFTNSVVLDDLNTATPFWFRLTKGHEFRDNTLMRIDSSLLEAINHLPTLGDAFKTSLLEGVCGSMINDARSRIPPPSLKGAHALFTNYNVLHGCMGTEAYKNLLGCVNFRVVIFEWFKMSRLVYDCRTPLLKGSQKNLCVTTLDVSLPVHNLRLHSA